MTNRTMTKEQILDLLREHKAMLIEQFGVNSLALFGSIARNQAKDSSDIDILVQFDGPATSKRYFGLQFYIEAHISHINPAGRTVISNGTTRCSRIAEYSGYHEC